MDNDALFQITNCNPLNNPKEEVYASFNQFIFSDDVKLLGKLLYRFKFFEQIQDLPGDIVEIGVFKGSGVATFSKFIDIFCSKSNKKVIGFDIFDTNSASEILNKDGVFDKTQMEVVYSKVDKDELTYDSVCARLNQLHSNTNYMLIKGDVEETIPKFLKEKPGFRISLIYIDVDLERPTYIALKHLWDRLLPGGVILFDEYEYHSFSESNGVDLFLKEMNIPYSLKSTNFIAPTAFMIKK